MKNIRRLIIVMTLAVMAMIIMTGAAFAAFSDMTLKIDGSIVTTEANDSWEIYNVESVSSLEFTANDDGYVTNLNFNDWSFEPIYSFTNGTDVQIAGDLLDAFKILADQDAAEDLKANLNQRNIEYVPADTYYYISISKEDSSDYRNILIHVESPDNSFYGLEDFKLGNNLVEPAASYEMTEGTAALLLRANNNTAFSALAAEDFTITNYAGDFSATVTAGNTYTAAARFMLANNTRFDIPEDDVRELLQLMGKGSEYYDDHSYKAIIFTNSSDEKVYVLCDFGYPPGPAGMIGTVEQLTDDSVSIEITGENIDFAENYIPQWFNANLKNADDEEIPIAIEFEVIDSTHIKCTYDVDKSYENKLGKEKGTAKLTVSYKGAEEPKTFDVTLPASSYWSKYAEEPQKIAKGDKDWPEFVGYYKISTPEELAWFAGLVNGELEGVAQNNQACAFLANDIVCNDTEGWENWDQNTTGLRMWDCTIGKGGYYSDPEEIQFRGIFDGNGFTVKGLYIIPDVTRNNYQSINKQGLIAVASGAVIRNLSVDESFVRAANRNAYVGGIVGDMSQTTVENCSFIGTVSNGNWAGGIVGGAESSDKIRRCFTNCTIVDSGNVQGRIAGRAYSTVIEDCYTMNGGVIIAQASQAKLYRCYTTGNVRLAPSSLPADNLVDCFCLDGSIEDTRVRRLTEEQFTDGTLLEGLNSDEYCADDGNKNGGRPILVWQSDLYKVKKAAIKEVTYYLDPNAYSLSADDLEEAIETAVANIEAAADQASVNNAKTAALAALDDFKSNADITGENNAEIERLKAELARINLQIELKGAKVKVAKAQVVYNGKTQKPAVTVTGKSGAVLEEGKDYTVAYSANTKPGIAKVTVTGAGDASAEVKTATFKILPKKAALKKVKSAKKKLTVSWTKDNTVTGYEVQYSLKKNFKGAKTAKITKAGTTKKVIKKLKSGKKYFVKVRSYKKAGKVMLYGAWSKAKNAKVK